MSALGTLLVGIAAVISSLVSAGALVISLRRGSDRESKRAATAAVEVVHEAESVIVVEPNRAADEL